MKSRIRTESLLRRVFPWLIVLALICRVTILVRRRTAGQFSSVDTMATLEIGLVAIGCLYLLFSKRKKLVAFFIKKSSTKHLFFYYILCLFSALWSLNLNYTLFRSVEILCLIFLIFLAMTFDANFFAAEKTYLFISFVSVVLSVLMHIKLHGGAVSLKVLHTNQYSAIAGMALAYSLGEWYERRGGNRKLLLFSVFLFGFFLVIGTSATSNVATATGLFVAMILSRRSKVMVLFFSVSALAVLYFSGSIDSFVMDIFFPGKTESEVVSLKGRTYLWTNYWQIFLDSPIYGYGFAVVSRMGSAFGMISTTNTHNGALEVLLGTGSIGMFFLFCWVLKILKETLTVVRKGCLGGVGFAGAFTVGMVNNMGRSMVGGAFDAPTVLFIVLLAFFIIHIRFAHLKNEPLVSRGARIVPRSSL